MNQDSLLLCHTAWCRTSVNFACVLAFIVMFDYGIVNADDTFAAIDAGESSYQKALQQARQGNFPAALKQFESLIGTYPANRRYYYDYIAVLGWAEQDQQVVEQLPRLDVPRTPVYVLETVAKSSRNLGNYDVAIDMYRAALKKAKRRLQSRAGLAMALADNGLADEALQVLDAAPVDQSDKKEILQARAYVLYRKQDYYAALSVYEKILGKTPDDHDAQRGLILTTARMGAPHQALRMAIKSPGLLTKDEQDTIEEQAIATDIRWSDLRYGSAAQRNMRTDEIIADLERKINALEAQGLADTAPRLQKIRTYTF